MITQSEEQPELIDQFGTTIKEGDVVIWSNAKGGNPGIIRKIVYRGHRPARSRYWQGEEIPYFEHDFTIHVDHPHQPWNKDYNLWSHTRSTAPEYFTVMTGWTEKDMIEQFGIRGTLENWKEVLFD